ncbi:MAG: hypothetical protein ACLTZT_19075 [Butyricimonas faecalis]
MKNVFVEQLRISDVDRDPRGRTITVAYYALVNPVDMKVAGYDDRQMPVGLLGGCSLPGF